MNAFNNVALRGFAPERTRNSGSFSGATPSRPVAQFWPVKKMDGNVSGDGNFNADREAFKQALYATLSRSAEGALSPFLFYDPPEFSKNEEVDYKSAWGSQHNVEYGARGWDAHIAESTRNSQNTQHNDYGFAEGDKEVIHTSIQEGLVNSLPKRITYYAYGPGELTAIRQKDFQLLDAIIKSPTHIVEALNAIDINDRYAKDFAQEANERYNKASAAIQGDFMQGTLDLGARLGTSVIGIFGGPFANAQRDEYSSKQNAARYLAQLVSQHGEGTRVINTLDTQSDENLLLADYRPTRRFEAFILGAFPRAVHEGIIKNKDYDVFKNWKLSTRFNAESRAVELSAEAKKSHNIITEDRTFSVKKDDKYVFTLSHKWNEKDWKDIYNAAGLDDLKFYQSGSRRLLVARAVREPDLSLL